MCYKLQYIDGLRPKDKWYFSFGSTMHLCAEYFFKVNVPPPPTLQELLQFYEQNWLSAGYESVGEEMKYKAYGRDVLTRFWEIHNTPFQMPLAIERRFYIDIEGVKLRGIIDRVDKLPGGGLSIVDYKTHKELFTAEDLEKDLQLTLYQLAAEQIWQLPVELLTLYHLRSNTACSCQPRSETRIEQARQLVTEVAGNIAQERFPATESGLCPCDFPEYCPYYRHLHLTSTPAEQGILPGIIVADAVENYVSLQEQIKELKVELENVKQSIVDFCQTHGLNRAYGNEHAVTYKLVEKSGFNEEEVRALLEPAGLWYKVLSLDPSLVKKLLSSEELDKDIRNKLAALRRITSVSPQLWVKQRIEEE